MSHNKRPKIALLFVATACAVMLENSAQGNETFYVGPNNGVSSNGASWSGAIQPATGNGGDAMLALSTAHTFAAGVNATYTTGAEVPVSSNGFTATGKTVNFTLNYAPANGAQLMVVQNTGVGIIRGTFSNLAQGQTVALSYAGVTYNFVANYYGGKGNDLVLLWTSGEESLPAATLKKLDAQIVLALKKSRGQPPFDKPTSLEPDIPVKDADRVLVDIEGSVSKELLDQVALVGGQVINGSATATTLRAMVPLSQLETLAGRVDVKFISPARLSVTSGVKAPP